MAATNTLRLPYALGADARVLAAQDQALSGHNLDRLVRRLQRQTGWSREAWWRLMFQVGLKSREVAYCQLSAGTFRSFPVSVVVRGEIARHLADISQQSD